MFSEAIWKYAQPAFRSAREMIPKEIAVEEKRKTERQFFRDRSALEEFERRTTKLPFLNQLKKAYDEFYIRETS